MANFFWYLFLFASLAIVIGGGVWAAWTYFNGTSPRTVLFGPRPIPRLAVVDHANVDGRRRLVLIRRDDTEHLIMTGGPVDVVIETGIPAPVRQMLREEPEIATVQPVLPVQPVFSRTPRAATGTGDSAAE